MQLESSKTQYRFDFLEKLGYTTCLHGILAMMEVRISDAKKKNINAKFDEQEKAAKDLTKIYCWVCALFEEKELMYRHNLNLERLNLELQSQVNELKKQIDVINQSDKF